MTAYYNELDAYPAQWLRNLIDAGLISPGHVDERSIADVRPIDLAGFRRAHFFAGIGGWERALQLAGWPDDEPVWTGSCPCQPFSVAGKQGGTDDARHLWPVWFDLIRKCRPPVVFGEQVEAAVRYGWLDAVQADLEAEGYAVGAAVLGAHSVGAPHIRQRLWFVAYAGREQRERGPNERGPDGKATAVRGEEVVHDQRRGATRELAYAEGEERSRGGEARRRRAGFADARHLGDAIGAGLAGRPGLGRDDGEERQAAERTGGDAGGLADPALVGRERRTAPGQQLEPEPVRLFPAGPSADSDFWRAEWLPCRDGKARPVEPGIQPLAHGVPARVGKLRAAGNAIVPHVAAEFIRAFLDVRAAA
jgi:DNA (cytosine-5)-methyltransferase 1